MASPSEAGVKCGAAGKGVCAERTPRRTAGSQQLPDQRLLDGGETPAARRGLDRGGPGAVACLPGPDTRGAPRTPRSAQGRQGQGAPPHPCGPGTRAGSTRSTGPAGPGPQTARTPSRRSGRGPASPAAPASRTTAADTGRNGRSPRAAGPGVPLPARGRCAWLRTRWGRADLSLPHSMPCSPATDEA